MGKGVILKVRLLEGLHDDLIAWYEGLPGWPAGNKAEAARRLLRAGLAKETKQESQLVADLMAALLPEIRAVVEATLETMMAQWQVMAVAPERGDADDETEAILDEIGAGLVLEDD